MSFFAQWIKEYQPTTYPLYRTKKEMMKSYRENCSRQAGRRVVVLWLFSGGDGIWMCTWHARNKETTKRIRMNRKKSCFSSVLVTGQQGLKIKGKISRQAYRIVNTVINVITIKMKVRLDRRTRNACVGWVVFQGKSQSPSLCICISLMYSLEFFRSVECAEGGVFYWIDWWKRWIVKCVGNECNKKADWQKCLLHNWLHFLYSKTSSRLFYCWFEMAVGGQCTFYSN